jgi:hypothetical protein
MGKKGPLKAKLFIRLFCELRRLLLGFLGALLRPDEHSG